MFVTCLRLRRVDGSFVGGFRGEFGAEVKSRFRENIESGARGGSEFEVGGGLRVGSEVDAGMLHGLEIGILLEKNIRL